MKEKKPGFVWFDPMRYVVEDEEAYKVKEVKKNSSLRRAPSPHLARRGIPSGSNPPLSFSLSPSLTSPYVTRLTK